MSKFNDKTQVPHIIQPRQPQPDDTSAADKQDDYSFFAYSPSERIDAVKKKIEEREKALFELEMLRMMLDGNPNPGEHLEEKDRKTKGPEGQDLTRPCNCGACELVRVNDAIDGLRYGLNKLRALHARMVG